MILDSSVLVAVLLREPGHEKIVSRIAEADFVGIGAPTLVEATIVLSARIGRDAKREVLDFLREAGVVVIPFGEEHFHDAQSAFLRYGKGNHRAGLNFGDCLAYAIAYRAGLPLLFKGDDFALTDLVSPS